MKKLLLFLFALVIAEFNIAQTISIIGTFNGWASDEFMTSADNENWTLDYTFTTNEQLKFRQNSDWLVNWGAATFPTGTGIQDGPNIPVLAGTFTINFNSTTGSYNFVSSSGPTPYLNTPNTQVLLQGFWWDYWNSNFPYGWANYLAELAPRLKDLGIDALWIPPSIKNTGTNSVGYAPFDHYDLGDKYQKGSVKTRLGDKDELLRMMAVLKANGIDVIQDVVWNHVTGAGSGSGAGGADPAAMDDGSTNKYKNFRYVSFDTPGGVESTNNYLSRNGRFPKNWQNFYPNPGNPCCTNEINSPYWGPDVSYEANAFGQSSNALYNPSQTSSYMRDGMRNWMVWYKKQMGWDGLRIDAVKHFPSFVTEDILWNLQNNAGWATSGENMYAVGEYVGGSGELDNWCNSVQNRAGTFDFSLRGSIYGMVTGNGNFDIGSIPSAQQSNRQRTVPFVNNHDTFRPQLDASGNYIGWNNALGGYIEPNDGRLSAAYAVAMAVDGSPQLFFEDLFSIGYNGNRFNHQPDDLNTLPVNSDLANLIWCHQHLHFKEGAYMVRWQASDALVIERENKALIAVTDNWSQWQNLSGVQTSWADGTVLVDYSGANTGSIVVANGGKVDIAIPPCDGSAQNGRRGYSVWAPEGVIENYERKERYITQEWEMDNDLGDRYGLSLQQGGRLPDNSWECRTVGKIFLRKDSLFTINVYPEDSTKTITLIVLDKECNPIDSISGSTSFVYSSIATYDGWHTLKIRNATEEQLGQKCWIKANYIAPTTVQTNVAKMKCACEFSTNSIDESMQQTLSYFPNPASTDLRVEWDPQVDKISLFQVLSIQGSKLLELKVSEEGLQNIDLSRLSNGSYYLLPISLHRKYEARLFLKL